MDGPLAKACGIIGGVIAVGVVAGAGYLLFKFLTKGTSKALRGKDVQIGLKLVDRATVSHDTFIYTFALPSPNDIIGLPIGNHLRLHARTGGETIARAYTPISWNDLKGYVKLVVKTYRKNIDPRFPAGGKMTQYLEGLPINSYVDVSGPIGNIHYLGDGSFEVSGPKARSLTTKKISMICGGSGLTPMYQIIQYILQSDTDRTNLAILYANKTEKDILMRDELEKFQDDYPQQFRVAYTVESPAPNWPHNVGYANAAMLEKEIYEPGDDNIVLLCGPPPMTGALTTLLTGMGYTKDRILLF